jgi:transcriptional regulator with XRE-family HTH domain
MSMKDWEQRVLAAPGARQRVAEVEDELRLATALTGLRERAGFSQRELAKRIGVSQPRIAAIERSRNVTLDVLQQYVAAVGGTIEVTVTADGNKITLMSARPADERQPQADRASA